jgi:hypothetical protein
MSRTVVLNKKSSFIRGIASAFNIGGTKQMKTRFYRDDKTALEADWYAVGDDLKEVFHAFEPKGRK